MIWFPIMANFAQLILRNIAQIWIFVKGEQILIKMKTQVDMVNSNTKTFSFYDLLSNFGQFCAANFVCTILRKIGSYFLKSEQISMKMENPVDMVNTIPKIFSFYDLVSNFGQFCTVNSAPPP